MTLNATLLSAIGYSRFSQAENSLDLSPLATCVPPCAFSILPADCVIYVSSSDRRSRAVRSQARPATSLRVQLPVRQLSRSSHRCKCQGILRFVLPALMFTCYYYYYYCLSFSFSSSP